MPLNRPYIRKSVRKTVEERAPKNEKGQFLDANTMKPIEGKYDLGHTYGHEHRREVQKAESEGLTQKEFNDRMNNPNYYRIEDPSENRSRKHEMKQGGSTMNEIDVKDISVHPFEFVSYKEFKIVKLPNEHATLYVRGFVEDEKQIEPLISTQGDTKVTFSNGDDIYFEGVLENAEIDCRQGEVYELIIKAVGNTILLDTEKHNRSFQENGLSYEKIVTEVISGEGSTATYNVEKAETVKNIILQYEETDWAFAKRLASHTQDVLIPITSKSPDFHFGATDEGGVTLDTKEYAVSRNFEKLRDMSTQEKSLSEVDITMYTIRGSEYYCDIGEKFTLNGNDLRVCSLIISLEEGEGAIVAEYKLCDKKAVSTPKFYNHAIIGLALDGKVLEVENDDLKLHLDIDDAQDVGTAHFFNYATGYSAEGHTGWYVMPEVGDKVQLYFPEADEQYAYAKSSRRTTDTDRVSDPLIKYWRTTFGKEIKMDKDEILITSKDNETYIQIRDDGNIGVQIITPHPVIVNSGSTLNIESADDMKLVSGKNLFINAKDSIELSSAGSSVTLNRSGVDIKGRIIKEN